MYRIFSVVIFLAFLDNLSIAQEVIDVKDEPFHKTIYTCDDFRVIKLEMMPGDTSAVHRHAHPILYLTIQGTRMWLDELENGTREANLPDFWIGSDNYSKEGAFDHRISVIGERNLILTAVIKYRNSDSASACSSIYSQDGFKVMGSSEICEDSQINIVKSGSCEISKRTKAPGDAFLSTDVIENPTSDFDYYQVSF